MTVSALIISVLMETYFMLIENKLPTKDFFSRIVFESWFNNLDMIRIIIIFSFFLVLIIAIRIYGRKTIEEFIYSYRYPIGLLLFFAGVFLEIHGSSVLYWQNYFEGSLVNAETIIGIPRDIRTDEWAVNTPMMLSQYFNTSGTFPYFSNTIRGAMTDAFIVYGQPVLDIAVVFRPFHWGYLFLTPARGLSFFWIGRMISLFFVSFEFGMVLAKKNKGLSLAYAVLITWAPIVQWWFAINGLVEMLVFGQLAIMMVALYMKKQNYFWRSIYAFIVLICAGGYALTFYPSWQVPLGYAFLALMIGTIYENWSKFRWRSYDVLIGVITVLLLGIGLGYVVEKSLDTILSVLGTVYPGNRFETGGGLLTRFFLYPGNLFFGLSRGLPYSNPCEWSVFFDFFPMGILIASWVLFKEKKKDIYLISMLTVTVLLSLWCMFEWPGWVAKITLLSYAQPARAYLAVGLLNIMLLIRALALVKTSLGKIPSIIITIALGFALTIVACNIYEGFIAAKMAIVVIIVMTVSFFSLLNGNQDWAKKTFLIIAVGIMFVSGMFINPLNRGLDVIYEQDIVKNIKQINDKNSGLWIVDSKDKSGLPIINIPLMVGAATINSTNVYPNLERWQILDPNKTNVDIYNRYAHISVNLVNTEVEKQFELTYADQFTVNLSVEDLALLDVKYVLTKRSLTELNTDRVRFIEKSVANGFRIYEVEYN